MSIVRADGRVDVAKLAKRLEVTPETIRRDLTVLERRGTIRRVHGGAIPVERLESEPPLSTRLKRLTDEKQRIALSALAEIPEDGVILLDSGSTTETLARALPHDRDLTVVTNSVPIAALLGDQRNLNVWCVGGRLREKTLALVDEWARQELAKLSADVAFLGTNGVSVGRGLTTADPSEAAVKAAMVQASRKRVVLADHTKIGRDSVCRFGTLEDVDVLITDGTGDLDLLSDIRNAGVKVIEA